ncbi:hypothetical protein ACFX11_030603 [Malus domestica]
MAETAETELITANVDAPQLFLKLPQLERSGIPGASMLTGGGGISGKILSGGCLSRSDIPGGNSPGFVGVLQQRRLQKSNGSKLRMWLMPEIGVSGVNGDGDFLWFFADPRRR